VINKDLSPSNATGMEVMMNKDLSSYGVLNFQQIGMLIGNIKVEQKEFNDFFY
jgi:hypothetical protein